MSEPITIVVAVSGGNVVGVFSDSAQADKFVRVAIVDYDNGEDRINYLREFYDNNEDRFTGSDSDAPTDTWFRSSDGREFKFETSDGRGFSIYANEGQKAGHDVTDISFADNSGSFEITGKGSAFEVFSNVVPAVVAYIKRENPSVVTFAAKGKSRQKLYDRLVSTVLGVQPGRFARRYDSGEFRHYVVGLEGMRDTIENMMSTGQDINPRSMAKAAKRKWVEIEPEIDPAWFTPEGWDDDGTESDDGNADGKSAKASLPRLTRGAVKAAHRKQVAGLEREVARALVPFFNRSSAAHLRSLLASRTGKPTPPKPSP